MTKLATEFAPAERASAEEVERQYRMLSELPFVKEFIDAVPNMAMVLNKERQIVFANRAFREFAGVEEEKEIIGSRQGELLGCARLEYIGKRPGEAAGCIRSEMTEGGCGTTVFCQTCGAVQSIVNSQKNNAPDVQECRMVCGESADPLDLRVWSRPLNVKEEAFTVFSVMDISDEKRRKALERIFFHDVLNTAGGMKGLADLLMDSELPEAEVKELAGMLSEAGEQLIEEISAQRILSAAEQGDLQVAAEPLNSLELLNRVVHQFLSMSSSQGKQLIVDEAAENFDFTSDPVLIRRVLINLTKNALEAVGAGAAVNLNCACGAEGATFTVHNAIVMPPEVQRQIFTRSFSTKGSGRGLGTYSIKLITEKYLHGEVSFVSNEKQGTVFTVCYPQRIEGTKR
jgi:nitrogen-specific signal transduction histidine kinase